MHLVIITSENEYQNELAILEEMANLEVHAIHLRKPQWTTHMQHAFLESTSSTLRAKLVVHQFPEHARLFQLAGWHRNRALEGEELVLGKPKSAAWHIQNAEPFKDVEYALCSPIFPSVSKPGYGPDSAYALNMLRAKCLVWENDTRKPDGSSSPIKIALSGVTPERVADAYMLGFDGVAALGYVWNHKHPLEAVQNLLVACNPPETED